MGECLTQLLKKKRIAKKIKQEDLAHLVGVRVRTIQRWEKKNFKPSRLAQERIRKVLDSL